MIRKTDPRKWDNSWYINLKPMTKLILMYMRDTCDSAGIWDFNKPLAEERIGLEKGWPGWADAIAEINKVPKSTNPEEKSIMNLMPVHSGAAYWLTKFIPTQRFPAAWRPGSTKHFLRWAKRSDRSIITSLHVNGVLKSFVELYPNALDHRCPWHPNKQ